MDDLMNKVYALLDAICDDPTFDDEDVKSAFMDLSSYMDRLVAERGLVD